MSPLPNCSSALLYLAPQIFPAPDWEFFYIRPDKTRKSENMLAFSESMNKVVVKGQLILNELSCQQANTLYLFCEQTNLMTMK
jgi:hypothetical protein